MSSSRLALLGGERSIAGSDDRLFHWPTISTEDEEAVLGALRVRDFPAESLIVEFERAFADWIGAQYVVAESSGTNALLAALFACGVGAGDEVIVPPCTYWATCVPVITLRATPVFADVERDTMNIAASDIERKLTSRTRAVVIVHLLGYPCDMDAIMRLARPRGVAVIEDGAHALGSLYRGRKVGVTADICAFSLSRKGLAVGEGGVLVTQRRDLHDRALAWGHSERFNPSLVADKQLLRFAGLALGGVTSRMHVLSAAMGISQLRRYDERMAEIDQAMNLFWDLLEGVPGIRAHRPPRRSGSTMGSWYNPHGRYLPEELSGLTLTRFIQALRAEGVDAWTWGGISRPLHLHPFFQAADVYREGKPSSIAHASCDTRAKSGDLPVAESLQAVSVPAFKRFDEKAIRSYANAFIKVVQGHRELITEY